MSGLRLISFGFDCFKSEVTGGLVSTLRFGSKVCVWFSENKNIWVLSFVFGGLNSGFGFSVWGSKI